MKETTEMMDQRLAVLLSMRNSAALSLRTAGELDCIQDSGLEAWREWLRKKARKSHLK